MANMRANTKAALLEQIESSWPALDSLLDRLTETQMTALQDRAGWTVKDHLVHLAAWEDSVTALFRGQPRHQAMGIDEASFTTGSSDEINALIQARRKDDSLHDVLAQLRASHESLMAALARLSDADLTRRARDLFPAFPARDERRLIDVIYENTAEHFDEHTGWIEKLVASG